MPIEAIILKAHVWVVAGVVPLLVNLFSLKTLLSLMTPLTTFRPYRNVPADRIVAAVRHRLRHPRHMRRRACLRLGLTLMHFLRLAGVPAILQIGTFPPSRDRRGLHAHCWVTVNGVAVADPPTEPLVVLVRHPQHEPVRAAASGSAPAGVELATADSAVRCAGNAGAGRRDAASAICTDAREQTPGGVGR